MRHFIVHPGENIPINWTDIITNNPINNNIPKKERS